eukprot:764410-Hanusia_phi.AAC.5
MEDELVSRTEWYKKQTETLRSELSFVGLTPPRMIPTIVSTLKTLSSAASILGVEECDTSSMVSAYSEMERETARLRQIIARKDAETLSMRQVCERMTADLSEVRSIRERLVEREQIEQQENICKQRDIDILEKKSMQYKNEIARLKAELKRNNVSDQIYHGRLVNESNTVKALHEQLLPLRKKMEGYHGLPTDVYLAKQQVRVARARLETVDQELQESITSVVIGQ